MGLTNKFTIEDKIIKSWRDEDNLETFRSDKTRVNIDPNTRKKSSGGTKDIHNMLMVAGMTPGVGNAADIADAVLYAVEGEFGAAALAVAAAVPILGQVASWKKTAKILADSKLMKPAIKKSKYAMQHVINQSIDHVGKTSKYKYLGEVSFKGEDYLISVTERSVPNITDKGYKLLENLKKVAPGKGKAGYEAEDLLMAISGNSRPAKVVKMVNKKTGKVIYQPFYKSTGRGVKEINSQGKWFPFEGVLPVGNKVKIVSSKGSEAVYTAKDAIFKQDFGPGEMPLGWVIKGFKSPKTGKIISSSIDGNTKAGLKIHREISKMLK